MEYLLVDGYNIINAWSDLFDLQNDSLEECRERFLNILSNYQGYKKTKVIVVFDAHMVKGGQEKKESFDHLTIIFTKENESADNYIERFVYKWGSQRRIRVATSDYLEQQTVLSGGATRMSARELREEVNWAETGTKGEKSHNIMKRNTIMSNIAPELLEKLEKIRRSKF